MKHLFLPLIFILPFCTSRAGVWHVGTSRNYTLPSQVKNLVQENDTIFLDEGIYLNDATKWTKNNLHFIGLGNGAILQNNINIANGKGIWVFESPGSSDNAYLENIIFDGAQVSDDDGGNGAGIRFQANNLTVNHCKFMNCQNGILEGNGSVSTSNVIILNSEFENNGYQIQNNPQFSGYEHNIYISASADTLLVMNCFFHHPRGQANSLKTRAQRCFILYNLIDEEDEGFGSWELNIAQGGLNIIMGNVIIQGTSGANHGIISYDDAINSLEDFYFINNTVINKFGGNTRFFNISPSGGINTFKIYNNVFASVPGANNTMISGNIPASLDTSHNVWFADFQSIGFTDPANNDYSLTKEATSLINNGTIAGSTNTDYSLTPMNMYLSLENDLATRTVLGGAIDIGAYEYQGTTSVQESETPFPICVFPNPFLSTFEVNLKSDSWKNANVTILNSVGQPIIKSHLIHSTELSTLSFDLGLYPAGIYFLEFNIDGKQFVEKIIRQFGFHD
ncbi:MAG: T9SS type A sorting domain-containing protein [Saprospiraceae bacterium]